MRRSTLAAAACGLVALGVAVGAVLSPLGSYLGEPDGSDGVPIAVPVSQTTTHDPLAVSVEPILEPARPLTAPADGVLTAITCEPGGRVASGTVVGAVDGRSISVLSTRVPPWRDITVGASGDDVSAFTAELARLGAPVSEVSTLDAVTARRSRDFLNGLGFALGTGAMGFGAPVLPLDRVIWLPSVDAEIGTCDAIVGATVTRGSSLATLAQQVTQLRIVGRTDSPLDGPRELLVGEASVAPEEDGFIRDPESIKAIMESAPGQEYLRGTREGVLSGELVLTEPVTVSAIPPSALVQSGATTCVRAEEGEAIPVTVVASAVGQVLVQAVSAPMPATVLLDLEGTATCS